MPFLGCSLELLDLLSQIIDISSTQSFPLSESHLKTVEDLELNLENIKQYDSATFTYSYSTGIAELYRLAILIYLYRVVKGHSRDFITVQILVHQAFIIINNSTNRLQPWPLFVVSLEANTEELRVSMLAAWDKFREKRSLSSVTSWDTMIRAAWVQKDLFVGEINQLLLYNVILGRNRLPPSFT